MTSPDDAARYAGRPFLLLLDCFVLWSIGELPEFQTERLTALTPKLQSTYGSTGTWQEIVSAQMEFADKLPGELRAMWQRNTERARELHEHLSAPDWARTVVDQNFI